MLAAHLDKKTIIDVYGWLFEETTSVPVEILKDHRHTAAAKSLEGTQHDPPETRGSVYFTARAGMSSVRDTNITNWVTPQDGLQEFQPDEFARSRQTLYLLSQDVASGTSAAAFVSALTTAVREATFRYGRAHGGRMDPPLLLVLDEAANICRIPDLPAMYSHLGSRGILPITILQSYAQGEAVWGRLGMQALWGASTIKLVGSGADDKDFAESVSRLIGDHEIDAISYSRAERGNSRSVSTRRESIMTAAEIRAMPKNQAVLLATGHRPALIELRPSFAGPHAVEISQAETTGTAQLTDRARSALNGGGSE